MKEWPWPHCTACRCGQNKSKLDPHYIACSDGKRKSKCPCLDMKQPCSEKCLCKNCSNVYGVNDKCASPSSSPVIKRRRPSPSPYKKKLGADYLNTLNVEPSKSVWTTVEECLLMSAIVAIKATEITPNVNNITLLYNSVANSRVCSESKLPVRIKKTSQILGKANILRENRRLYYLKVPENEGRNMCT